LPYTHLYPIHTALTFVLMAAMYFGWLIFGSLFLRGGRKISLLGSKTRNQEKRLLIAMWCLLITAFVMQWLYTLAYGGFLGLLEYSSSIRSAIFPIQNSLSFLKPFGGLALFASFGFFGLWLSRYRRPAVWLGLCLSSLFSLYILYSWMGRIGFLTYLATFVLGARYCQILWIEPAYPSKHLIDQAASSKSPSMNFLFSSTRSINSYPFILFQRIGSPYMQPMSSWEITEIEQHFLIFLKTLDRL